MKKKRIKKMEKKLDMIYNVAVPKKTDQVPYIYSKYSKDASKKFKKLFLSLLNYPNGISISYNENDKWIKISSENIKTIKNKTLDTCDFTPNYSMNDQLMMDVNKNGFSIIHGHDVQSRYKDKNIYDDLIDTVKKKKSDINYESFNLILSEISKKSGIIRDSNLDEILN